MTEPVATPISHPHHELSRPAVRIRVVSRTAELVIFAVLSIAALCVFYREIIFENRTFVAFGPPAEVMGAAPPWGFTGTVRPNPYRVDAGGSAWQLEPWARTIGLSYQDRSLPLWNPHQFFGTPLLGDAQPGAFDILRLPPMLSIHAWAWDVYYLLQALLSLGLTYGFGRSVGFRPAAATVGALGYTFCGFMFIRGNMHYAEIYHVLPGVLWGTELLVRGTLRRGLLLVAGCVALAILAGFPEATLLSLLYAASFGAFRAIWLAAAEGSWRLGVQRGLLLVMAWLIGIGVAAPMLGPVLEYVGLSFNIHSADRNLGLIALPLRSLAFLGVPYISGLPTQPLVPFDPFPVDDYSGTAVLVLAVIGVLSLRVPGRTRSIVAFALASALIWGAKLFGVPGINELGRLPVLVQMLIYIFGTPILSLSLALLAAAGVDALAIGRLPIRAILAAGVLFGGYLAFATFANWAVLINAGKPHALATLGLAGAAGVAILACAVFTSHRPALAAGAACLVVFVELAALAPRDVYSDRFDSLNQPPFVGWLQQQSQFPGQPFRVYSNDGVLYPDYASPFGLDDLRDVDALYPKRGWAFVQTFLSPSISDRYVGGWGHPELPTQLFANKWLNFSNVRFILRPAGQSPADATLAPWIISTNYPPTDAVHIDQVTIDGQRREVLVERTPGDVTYRFTPSAAQPTLTFFVGLNPLHAPGIAGEFLASIEDNGQRQLVFDETVADADGSAKQWHPGSIDLTPYIGHNVQLVLQTRSDHEIAATDWGDLRLQPQPDPNQFKQVYAGEVSIWENTQVAPRAFLVSNVRQASTSSDAVAQMQAPDFDPTTQAVVEGDVSINAVGSSSGDAVVTSYSAQQVQLNVSTPGQSLLVMTDTYYPGWSATVDGQPTPIWPTDLAFRGVVVPPGVHQVSFHYAPVSFEIGVAAAAGALVLLGLAMWQLSVRVSR